MARPISPLLYSRDSEFTTDRIDWSQTVFFSRSRNICITDTPINSWILTEVAQPILQSSDGQIVIKLSFSRELIASRTTSDKQPGLDNVMAILFLDIVSMIITDSIQANG